jgi:hypothetical protein
MNNKANAIANLSAAYVSSQELRIQKNLSSLVRNGSESPEVDYAFETYKEIERRIENESKKEKEDNQGQDIFSEVFGNSGCKVVDREEYFSQLISDSDGKLSDMYITDYLIFCPETGCHNVRVAVNRHKVDYTENPGEERLRLEIEELKKWFNNFNKEVK